MSIEELREFVSKLDSRCMSPRCEFDVIDLLEFYHVIHLVPRANHKVYLKRKYTDKLDKVAVVWDHEMKSVKLIIKKDRRKKRRVEEWR